MKTISRSLLVGLFYFGFLASCIGPFDNPFDSQSSSTSGSASTESQLNGIWKIISSTNSYNSYNPRAGETFEITNAAAAGTTITGNISWTSISNGTLTGTFAYSPTGQTLALSFSSLYINETWVNVSLSAASISGTGDYSYTMAKQTLVQANAQDLVGIWKVISSTNSYSSYNPRAGETFEITNATAAGTTITGNVTWTSISNGILQGMFVYSPTGQTLAFSFSSLYINETWVNLSSSATSISGTGDYSYTMAKQ